MYKCCTSIENGLVCGCSVVRGLERQPVINFQGGISVQIRIRRDSVELVLSSGKSLLKRADLKIFNRSSGPGAVRRYSRWYTAQRYVATMWGISAYRDAENWWNESLRVHCCNNRTVWNLDECSVGYLDALLFDQFILPRMEHLARFHHKGSAKGTRVSILISWINRKSNTNSQFSLDSMRSSHLVEVPVQNANEINRLIISTRFWATSKFPRSSMRSHIPKDPVLFAC